MAGLFAAAVLAALLQVNAEYGYLPELGFARLLGDLFDVGVVGGWALHFFLGGAWGALFAWLDPDLPGDNLRQRGILFASLLWLVMMLSLFPLAGLGFFGLGYGILLPLAALALHILFGAVMGRTYAWLLEQGMPIRYREPRPAEPATQAPAVELETVTRESVPTVPSLEEPVAAVAATAAEIIRIGAARSGERRSNSRKSNQDRRMNQRA